MVAVRTTTAEAALSASERASRIVLAKVDVEGAELHALRSLLSTMPKIDNIVIETSPGCGSLLLCCEVVARNLPCRATHERV